MLGRTVVTLGVLLGPAAALAQGATLACQEIPTFFPRGDHWALAPGETVYYRTHSAGSDDVSTGADLAAVDRAFASWPATACAAGGHPNLSLTNAYAAAGNQHYATRDRGDVWDAQGNLLSVQNIVYWIESAAAWPGDSMTLALTTSLYLPDTGVVVTSDIELNGVNWQWRTRATPGGAWVGCTYGGSQCFDIETVVLHEVGHFLGLNHVECTDAVMYAQGAATGEQITLPVHERTAVCAIYPPRPASPSTPRVFGEQCDANADCPDGLCITPVGLEGSGWGWCSIRCDCTEGCARPCPQAFVCARQDGGTIDFCKPGVHLTGPTAGSCACDVDWDCTVGCVCDPECTGCSTSAECSGGLVCDGTHCVPCTGSGQCSGGKVCLAGKCSACRTASDCSVGQICAAGACGPCTSTAQCGVKVCQAGSCVNCTGNAECEGGQVCPAGSCVPCTSHPQCSGGQLCQDGRCSACTTACPGGQVCVGGACVACTGTAQCTSGKVCVGGSCVACSSSTQCLDGKVCVSGACAPCTGNSQCGGGTVCAAGACVPCTSTAQCGGGLVCVAGACGACTSDGQCGAGLVCNALGRCETAPESGGGSTDPSTNLPVDFGAPCSTGAQCTSGLCMTDGVESRCTQACVPGMLPGGVTPASSCPPAFTCQMTDLNSTVCWPDDPEAWSGGGAGTRADLNELCFQAMGPAENDDWYLPCGPDLVCFNFKPRCEGQEGACVPYCGASLPCPDANQTCCFGVDDDGACLGSAADRPHGGCFLLRDEGELCVAAERSICAAGLGCFHFGDPSLARCYRRCDSSACADGASCQVFLDACADPFGLCCADAGLPAVCEPGVVDRGTAPLGFACRADSDCESDRCVSYGDEQVCSRRCNPTTGFGCPDESYDVDGDGVGDGGFDCLAGADGGFCWPRQGPLSELEPEPAPRPKKKPPAGGCAAISASAWAALLLLLRRRRPVDSGARKP